jgi:hypothetical protein
MISATTRNGTATEVSVPHWNSTALMEESRRLWQAMVARRQTVTVAATFILIMIAYLKTVLLGPAFFDTAEYQAAPYVLGNMHQTGYPLYGVVGKIFGTLVPLGSFAYRMNLMSSLFLAIAASMMIVVSLRYRVLPLLALAAALCFAFEKNTWQTAVHADPHPLTVLIAISLWLMAFKWRDTGDRRWLWAMALLSGLGLGAAAVLVAELPAIILFAVLTQPRKFFWPPTMIVAALLGVIGLVGIYTYLPIRAMMHAPMNYWDPQTWERFKDVVLSGGGDLYSWHGLQAAPGTIAYYAPQIYGWYGEWLTPAGRAIAWGLGFIGLLTLIRRDWRLALVFFIGLFLPMYASITVPNAERGRYFMTSNWLLFFLAGLGTQALVIDPLMRIKRGSIRQSLSVLAVLLCLIFPCYLAYTFWNPKVDGDTTAEDFIDGVFAAVKEPNAVIISWWGSSTALWYGHFVEGKGPDVTIIDDSECLPQKWQDLTSAIDLYYGKRPVYAVSWPDELARYGKKYELHQIAKLDWFGMTVNQVVGRKDASSKSAPKTSP